MECIYKRTTYQIAEQFGKSSATHTMEFCEKVAPKLSGFDEKL
jgi:hypothetical protein